MKITAYHEAGHTLVGMYTKDARPVHKVTIVAKGESGGHTAFIPNKDEWHQTRSQLLAIMDVSMGGRVAEELIFGKGEVTGGAMSDFTHASNIAETMVKQLGMSEKIGIRVYNDERRIGDATKATIDEEINDVLNASYKRAMKILKDHPKELKLLAEALINHETLDGEEVKIVIQGKPLPEDRKGGKSIKPAEKTKNTIVMPQLLGGGGGGGTATSDSLT